jgi:chloramphenicol 3-O phosphotransferase
MRADLPEERVPDPGVGDELWGPLAGDPEDEPDLGLPRELEFEGRPVVRTGSTGVVVIVDGPTGVGKSTLIDALQDAWPRLRPGPLLDVGLDQALAALGPTGLTRWWDLIRHVRTPGASAPMAWGPMGRELAAGMHQVVAAWALAGFDVAVEHVLLDRTTVLQLTTALGDLPTIHLGLTCDPDVLEDRERERAGRSLGPPAEQLAATRQVARRDAVLDTTEATTRELLTEALLVIERRLLQLGLPLG